MSLLKEVDVAISIIPSAASIKSLRSARAEKARLTKIQEQAYRIGKVLQASTSEPLYCVITFEIEESVKTALVEQGYSCTRETATNNYVIQLKGDPVLVWKKQ